ncbi:Enoyl-CoA hydratase/carnithine racemase [Monaibacterium marinum]|uniref:Enoyl-CoA hydratase domain-containing protein 3, mitochondrial n=1 Tax=Pontivivens marinum TaxID=1690039 RepID=A0A2C9CPR8_9RHOB|nr:enoyl-CoA hydratase [Monaibacterium marinum]SOH93511.1 Enoyl-CoA hydratase/carnithine racemase [Monaibacterium marinum]
MSIQQAADDTILIREDTDGIATLTLNHPAKLNPLSEEMLAALQAQLDGIAGDPRVRAVILRGAGKAFCAGHDLRQMTAARQNPDSGAAYFRELFGTCTRVMTSIRNLPQPVIAQVHGIATAAGCQLVATCDMAVAADDTRFGVNGVNIGLFCSTPMVALSRNIGRKQAFEMLTTGAFIDANRACEVGLINRSAPQDRLQAETIALAQTVAAKLSSAVRIGKRAFYQQMEMGLDDAYAYTGEVMALNMADADTEEGIAAFLEKRDARWENP